MHEVILDPLNRTNTVFSLALCNGVHFRVNLTSAFCIALHIVEVDKDAKSTIANIKSIYQKNDRDTNGVFCYKGSLPAFSNQMQTPPETQTYGSVQACSNSIANALELPQSCTKASSYSTYHHRSNTFKKWRFLSYFVIKGLILFPDPKTQTVILCMVFISIPWSRKDLDSHTYLSRILK